MLSNIFTQILPTKIKNSYQKLLQNWDHLKWDAIQN